MCHFADLELFEVWRWVSLCTQQQATPPKARGAVAGHRPLEMG